MHHRFPGTKNDSMRELMRKYVVLLARPYDILENFVSVSREIKVIRALPRNPFCGPCNLSVFLLIHELLMDECFKLTLEDSLSSLVRKYALIPTSPLVITHFLLDLCSAFLWVIQEPT